MSCITINTDASFHPESKVGGYAFYIVCDLFKIQKSGLFKKKPKNSEEAEIMCIGNAIATLLAQKELPNVNIIVINNDCLHGMEKIKNVHGAKGVYNEVAQLVNIMKKTFSGKRNVTGRFQKINIKVDFRHVKAHNGTPDSRSWVNDWCDREAKKQMRRRVKEFAIQMN